MRFLFGVGAASVALMSEHLSSPVALQAHAGFWVEVQKEQGAVA